MDENKDIRERLLEFLEITRLAASVIGNVILNFLEQKEIELKTVEDNAMTVRATCNQRKEV